MQGLEIDDCNLKFVLNDKKKRLQLKVYQHCDKVCLTCLHCKKLFYFGIMISDCQGLLCKSFGYIINIADPD